VMKKRTARSSSKQETSGPIFTAMFHPNKAFEKAIAGETEHLKEFARRGFYPGYADFSSEHEETPPEEYIRILALVRKHNLRRQRLEKKR
jgi:hypothetical protein